MQRRYYWLIALLILIVGQAVLSQDSITTAGLYRVNADGSGLQAIVTSEVAIYWSPALSNDGSLIAVMQGGVGIVGGELIIVSSDGSSSRSLTSNGRTNYHPIWSPDDQRIAFISQENGLPETAEIFVIQADGSGETRLTDDAGWKYGVDWSPDGQSLIFGSEQDGAWSIFTMNADGSNLSQLALHTHGNVPSFSPDGQKIAFVSDRDGDDDIYIGKSDGNEQVNITNNSDWDDQSRWSPDGSRIAFTSYRNERYGIYTIDVVTGETVLLAESTNLILGFPFWSPDSSYLVFHAEKPQEDSSGIPAWFYIGGGLILLVLGVVLVFRWRGRANKA